MSGIKVVLLGKFDIFINGRSALAHWGNSSKSVNLLKYLILNIGKPSAISTLIDVFWPDDHSGVNPESALKTMVSRIRANLAKADPSLKNCIVSETRAYMWNTDIPCEVDVFEFELLCGELENTEAPGKADREKYTRILDIYAGDVSCSLLGEEWALNRSIYLHSRYMRAIYDYLTLLSSEGDNEAVIIVSRRALLIDEYDEKLNMELMRAFKATGRDKEAMQYYRRLTAAFHKHLGVPPSEEWLDFYNELSASSLEIESDLHTVRKKLENSGDHEGGALICDFPVFKNIYQMHLRNSERNESGVSIALLGVQRAHGGEFEPQEMAPIMDILLDILHKSLRKGDVISHYSPSQYSILMPMMNSANGKLIQDRVKKYFFKAYSPNDVKLVFHFDSIGGNEGYYSDFKERIELI